MVFLPPFGGVFRLAYGIIAGYSIQTVIRFSRSME